MGHCAIIDEELNVLSFGQNDCGQLGLGDFESRSSPTKMVKLPRIISISIGEGNTLLLDDQGFVWYCGILCSDSIDIPTKLVDVKNIIKMASGRYHSLLLDNEGSVFAFGNNKWGQLGFVDRCDKYIPTKIEGLPMIEEICCGSLHSILIDIKGNCWSFGYNGYGGLGFGSVEERIATPTKIENLPSIRSVSAGSCYSILIDIDDNVYSCGYNYPCQLRFNGKVDRMLPTLIEGLPKIKSAHCGEAHTILIDINNNIWGFGTNYYGQLGLPHCDQVVLPTKSAFVDDIHSIICFGNCTLIITTKGDCFVCGSNKYGQLGLGDQSDRNILTKIEGLKSIVKNNRFKKTKNARN